MSLSVFGSGIIPRKNLPADRAGISGLRRMLHDLVLVQAEFAAERYTTQVTGPQNFALVRSGGGTRVTRLGWGRNGWGTQRLETERNGVFCGLVEIKFQGIGADKG